MSDSKISAMGWYFIALGGFTLYMLWDNPAGSDMSIGFNAPTAMLVMAVVVIGVPLLGILIEEENQD